MTGESRVNGAAYVNEFVPTDRHAGADTAQVAAGQKRTARGVVSVSLNCC
jgi:hypothetical protein